MLLVANYFLVSSVGRVRGFTPQGPWFESSLDNWQHPIGTLLMPEVARSRPMAVVLSNRDDDWEKSVRDLSGVEAQNMHMQLKSTWQCLSHDP